MVFVKEESKDGKVLKTKEGEILKTYKFEEGDVFIPQNNSVVSKSHKANVKGKDKTIVTNKLVCKVKGFNLDKEGKEQEIFVTLTPSQFNTIQKKLDNGDKINQMLFNGYIYQDKEGNDWVGIGVKSERIPPKSFEELEKESEELKEEEE